MESCWLGCGSPIVTVMPPRRVAAYASASTPALPTVSITASAPPPVAARTSSTAAGPAITVCVAPSSRARSSFDCTLSDATMVVAPAATAPSRAARPTPPSPKIATLSPIRTFAACEAAPTPVITAQPNSAAISNGRSGSTRTAERADTTAYSANAEMPGWWCRSPSEPGSRPRRSAPGRLPAVFAPAAPRRAPSCRQLEARGAAAKRRRYVDGPARAAVDEDVHEPALRQRAGLTVAAELELVAHARPAELPDPQSDVDPLGEGDPAL